LSKFTQYFIQLEIHLDSHTICDLRYAFLDVVNLSLEPIQVVRVFVDEMMPFQRAVTSGIKTFRALLFWKIGTVL
jgi:hypothetical protein